MAALVFGSLFGLLFLGVPVAFAIGLSCVIVFLSGMEVSLRVVAQRIATGMDSFPLLAVPLFILVGNLMDKGGISKRLINWAESVIGFMPGGLGLVAILACTMFAALTGSGPATVAAIGTILIPSMIERGYSKRMATGLITSAGALGPIIPPSIPMIIYGCTMMLSIPDMFIGGVIPGLIISGMLMLVNYILAKRTPAIMQAPRPHFSFGKFVSTTFSALGALLLPIVVLGGIYAGIFTPTEAAAVAVVYSLLVGFFVYRELSLKELPDVLVKTMQVSGMGIFITGTANVLSFVFTTSSLTQQIVDTLILFINDRTTYLIVLMLFLFVVGCLMDTIASILIIAPIIVPLGIKLGVDPLHLGVLFVINLVIGFVTPPFGTNLFTACAITGLKFEEVVKGTLPFLLVEIIAVFLFAAFPGLITWLPGLMR